MLSHDADFGDDDDDDDFDDYRVYDDEDLDPDFQGAPSASKKSKSSDIDTTTSSTTPKKKKSANKKNGSSPSFPDESSNPTIDQGISTKTEPGTEEAIGVEKKPSIAGPRGTDDPHQRATESPDAVTLDDDDDEEDGNNDDDDDAASTTSAASSPAKPTQPKKVQMQLRFKCLDKACPKKFITKVALNTHCKRNHPQLLKQRAQKEEQMKLQEMRLKRRQALAVTALRGGGNATPGARPASTALNGLATSPMKSFGSIGGPPGSPSTGFMSRPAMPPSGMGTGGGFPSMGSFPPNGYRPSGFGATNANPMHSLNSPFNTSSATSTYSSLKSTLMRGASGLFGQRPPQPPSTVAYGGIAGAAAASPFGAAMGGNSRFPTSPFGSPQKTAPPVSPFGSPQKSPFGSSYGVSSLSPSASGLRGGVGAGALVPSISSLTSPSGAQRPFSPNFSSGGLGRGGMGSPYGGAGGSPSTAGGMARWPAMTSSQQLQQLSRPNGARPAVPRPALRGRGGPRTPGSGAAGASPRFTRVHASQFLNSSGSAASSSPSGGAARMASPGQSPAKAGTSDSSTALTHKCRFPSCQGKSFLTEQVGLTS